MSFSYYPFGCLAPRVWSTLRKLRRLREVHLEHTEVSSLHLLVSLCTLPTLTALRISAVGNPAVNHPLFRSFVVALLPLLRSLNGREVTTLERDSAELHWRRLKRLCGLSANCLHAQLASTAFQHAMQFAEVVQTIKPEDEVVDPSAFVVPSFSSPAKSGGSGALPTQAGGAGAKREASVERPRGGILEMMPTEQATRLGDQFVGRVVDHALAVNEKITQLNATWPHIVATYEERVKAELVDRAVFMNRYDAACKGDRERTTLAALGPSGSATATSRRQHGVALK